MSESKVSNETGLFVAKDHNHHTNRLIESRHEFTVLERKMLYGIINQMKLTDNVQEDLFGDMYFTLPVSFFGQDYNFHRLRQAINRITTRNISGGNAKKEHAWSITPIPYAELKNGKVVLKVQKEAVPYFIDYKKKGYTTYELGVVLSLTSAYSMRLYELLSRWKDLKRKRYTIEELKFLLGIDKERSYNGPTANGNIKKWVLEPAQKELAEKTDIEFTYSFEKEGRKFVAINFEIFTKEEIKQLETAEAREEAVEILEQLADATPGQQTVWIETALAGYQFTEVQKNKIRQNHTLKAKFVEVHAQIEMGVLQIQSTPTNYMAGILRKLGWS